MGALAIYHCSISVISRSAGQSAVAAAAYRAAVRLEDNRIGSVFDYRAKSGVRHSEIILPPGAPPTLGDRSSLWNAAEAAETRKNSRPARECRLALPAELSAEDNLALAQAFAHELTERYGVAVDLAIHEPDRSGDERNVHAHLLFTTRQIGSGGFGDKVRVLDDRRQGEIEIRHLRARWRELANMALEQADVDARIDERSFVERELLIEPTKHLGPWASDQARSGKATELDGFNQAALADWPSRVIETVTRTRAVFTEQDVAIELHRAGLDPNLRQLVLSEAAGVIRLYDKETGDALNRYTTTAIRAQERRVISRLQTMVADGRHGVSQSAIKHSIAARSLDAEQGAALLHATDSGAVKLVEGRAGTGKSYAIHAIRDAFEADRYRVIGLAPTNTVANDLKAGGFSEARTVHSLLWHADQEREKNITRPEASLDPRTVLIVDEAGMVDTRTLDRLSELAKASGAKLILVGDERQLGSIERGGMFGAIRDEFGGATLSTVRRQADEWAQEASSAFARGDFHDGIKAYDEHGYVHWSADKSASIAALLEQWRADTAEGIGARLVFAYTNRDVDQLNSALQAIEIERGRVGQLHPIATDRGEIMLGVGDRIQFRTTDKRLGVHNGGLGRVIAISGQMVMVEHENGQAITLDTATYGGLALGYAGTIYKGQGKTLDQAYLLHTGHWRDQASYVAMTRARAATYIFVSQEEARDLDYLARQMSRTTGYGASLRYATATELPPKDELPLERKPPPPMSPRGGGASDPEPPSQGRIAPKFPYQAATPTADLARAADTLHDAEQQLLQAIIALVPEHIATAQLKTQPQALQQTTDPNLVAGEGAEPNPSATYEVSGNLRSVIALEGYCRSIRYQAAIDRHHNPNDPLASLVAAVLEDRQTFHAEQDAYNTAIIAETDPNWRDMLMLCKDIEFLNDLAHSYRRCVHLGHVLTGAEPQHPAQLSHQELPLQAALFDHGLHQAYEEWINRSVARPDLYPPLNAAMTEIIDQLRTASENAAASGVIEPTQLAPPEDTNNPAAETASPTATTTDARIQPEQAPDNEQSTTPPQEPEKELGDGAVDPLEEALATEAETETLENPPPNDNPAEVLQANGEADKESETNEENNADNTHAAPLNPPIPQHRERD